MKLSFGQFKSLAPCKVVVHSLDQALYQVTVIKGGQEHLLVEDGGKAFRRHSIGEVVEVLRFMPVESAVLRQRSAYDEMVGQPLREGDNVLEVPLRVDSADAPVRH